MTARLNAFINRYGWPVMVGLTLVIIPGVAGLLKDFFELKGEVKSLKNSVEIIRADDLPEIKEELQHIHQRLFHLGALNQQSKNSPDGTKKTSFFFFSEGQMGQGRSFCPVKRVDNFSERLLGFLGSFHNNNRTLLGAEAHTLYILVLKNPFLLPIVHVKSFVCKDIIFNKIKRSVAFTGQKQEPAKVSSKIIEIRGMRAMLDHDVAEETSDTLDHLMLPTKIGKKLNLTGHKINKRLMRARYQLDTLSDHWEVYQRFSQKPI